MSFLIWAIWIKASCFGVKPSLTSCLISRICLFKSFMIPLISFARSAVPVGPEPWGFVGSGFFFGSAVFVVVVLSVFGNKYGFLGSKP